jgi:hypothetical protein
MRAWPEGRIELRAKRTPPVGGTTEGALGREGGRNHRPDVFSCSCLLASRTGLASAT